MHEYQCDCCQDIKPVCFAQVGGDRRLLCAGCREKLDVLPLWGGWTYSMVAAGGGYSYLLWDPNGGNGHLGAQKEESVINLCRSVYEREQEKLHAPKRGKLPGYKKKGR